MNLISVILPSHNSAAFVRDSVQSVLNQTHADLELIAVDDGSTDETLAILRELASQDQRMTVVSLAKCSGGPAKPRNVGLKAAKGRYLAFIDSDDAWHTRKLELQLSVMKRDGLGFSSTQHVPFQVEMPAQKIDALHLMRARQADSLQTTPITHRTLIRKNRVVTSSALMTKAFAKQLRFDEREPYIGIEDYLAWLLLHQNARQKSAVLHLPLVFYRLRDDSISSSKLVMARKIFYLLKHYQIDGGGLGVKRHFYFLTYVAHSVVSRLLR